MNIYVTVLGMFLAFQNLALAQQVDFPHNSNECPALSGTFHFNMDPSQKTTISKSDKGITSYSDGNGTLKFDGSIQTAEEGRASAFCSNQSLIYREVCKDGTSRSLVIKPSLTGYTFEDSDDQKGPIAFIREK